MKKSVSLARIEGIIKRIENNSFVDNDVLVLMVTLRELPRAGVKIFEIGSFVAHSDVRDKGVVKDILSRNYYMFSMSLGSDRHLIDSDDDRLPYYFPDVIKMQAAMIGHEKLANDFGVSKGKIKSLIDNLISKKTMIKNGEYFIVQRPFSPIEIKLLQHCTSIISTDDGISIDELISDIRQLLKVEAPLVNTQPLEDRKREIFCALACLMNDVRYVLVKDKGVNASTIIYGMDRVQVSGVFRIKMVDKSESSDAVYQTIMHPVFYSGYNSGEIFDGVVDVRSFGEKTFTYNSSKGLISVI